MITLIVVCLVLCPESWLVLRESLVRFTPSRFLSSVELEIDCDVVDVEEEFDYWEK